MEISLGYAAVGLVGSEGRYWRYAYIASGMVVTLAARLCDEAADGEIMLRPRRDDHSTRFKLRNRRQSLPTRSYHHD